MNHAVPECHTMNKGGKSLNIQIDGKENNLYDTERLSKTNRLYSRTKINMSSVNANSTTQKSFRPSTSLRKVLDLVFQVQNGDFESLKHILQIEMSGSEQSASQRVMRNQFRLA